MNYADTLYQAACKNSNITPLTSEEMSQLFWEYDRMYQEKRDQENYKKN